MTIVEQIKHYLESLSELKRLEMQDLHALMLKWMPDTELSFESGKNDHNKTISNPVIGYGSYHHTFANGEIKSMFQIGISANTMGISIYCMGLKDKAFLKANYSNRIGKASITGYCIKFKRLRDLNINALEDIVRHFIELE